MIGIIGGSGPEAGVDLFTKVHPTMALAAALLDAAAAPAGS